MTLGRALAHEVRMLLIAVQFLTRLPVPAWVSAGFEPGWLNRCVVHFPLVGLLVGGAGAVVLWLASQCWTPLVAALLATAASAALTGAFHEDGLADTFDALGGPVTRERALVIMKDSRIGSYGALALGLALALRVALLAALVGVDPLAAALALVAAQLLGRAAAVGVMAWLPYAGEPEHAKAKPLATRVRWQVAAAALGCAAVLLIGTAVVAAMHTQVLDAAWAWRWAAAPSAAVAVVVLMRRWLRLRLGGYTGDTLGASEQLTEVAVLLALAGG